MFYKRKLIIKIVLFLTLIFLAGYLLKDDFLPYMSWWMVLLLLGFIFLPLTQKLFSSFHDNGYLFSKTIGVAMSAYFMWLLSSIKLLKFTTLSCHIVVIICLVANFFIFYKSRQKENKSLFTFEKLDAILTDEILFFAFFLLWTYIRGFKPEAYGTEKFMDYGFMTSMMRADYMPPSDLWFAGGTINYYYIGQYIATFMTKISFVSVNVGYNLMLMMLASFSFVLPYSLIYNVTKNILDDKCTKGHRIPFVAGILSGAGVSFAGNMHFVLYYWIVPILRTVLGIQGEYPAYWFPNSTRYIGYNPETTDKTIHEFPSYSFVLGDLHAHVLNIIFVLTVLGILYAWLLQQRKYKELIVTNNLKELSIKNELLNPYILILGFFIGLFHMTNFWDFPIYYVVAGAVILFFNGVLYDFKLKMLWITALQGAFIMVVAKITALPFTLNFDQISTKIRITVAHTPIYQLIILWGLPVILIIGLIIELITKFRIKPREIHDLEQNNENNKSEKYQKTAWKRFLETLNISDLFILILGLCAMGLVWIPEVIYVKDIYEGDFKRANTMFKLTYQAFIMFGLCSGYIFTKFFKFGKYRWQKKLATITFILFLSSLWYSKVSVYAFYPNVFKVKEYKGLDAAKFMESNMNDDYYATQWMNKNIEGVPVILEANGDSYSDYGRVSVMTGLPTVLGWYVHEWLWRGDTDILNARATDIQTIYTSTDQEQVRNLIQKYNIEYLYVGKLEVEKFKTINHNLIKDLGKTVFIRTTTAEKEYETYIIHIE